MVPKRLKITGIRQKIIPPGCLSELVELVTQDDEQPIFEDSTISDIRAETTYGIISQKASGNDS